MVNLDRAFPYQKSHMAITPLLIILDILSVVCYGTCGLTGNRTRHTAVTGRRYSRLTMRPIAEDVSILVGQPPIGFHQLMNPLRASGRARTNHLLITNQLLYQMSYGGKIRKAT